MQMDPAELARYQNADQQQGEYNIWYHKFSGHQVSFFISLFLIALLLSPNSHSSKSSFFAASNAFAPAQTLVARAPMRVALALMCSTRTLACVSSLRRAAAPRGRTATSSIAFRAPKRTRSVSTRRMTCLAASATARIVMTWAAWAA
jgi:hypothetical protein